MRKWFLPITVLSLGGLGAFLLTEIGQQSLEWLADTIEGKPTASGWDERRQRQLEDLRAALEGMSDEFGRGRS